MTRRALWILTLAALVGLGAPTTDDARSGPAPRADRDGDRIFESLEARLGGKPDSARAEVIVVLGPPATDELVRSLARRVGGFTVSRRFDFVHGFAATMRKEQLGRLASVAEVAHIEANENVYAAIDSAQASFGVAQAKADAGVDGNADGSPDTYSGNDLVAAVVDSGIDVGHADLDEGKVIGWADLVNDLPLPYDDLGHGTAVAAVLAGDGDGRPDKRYKGIAPGAGLVGVKVLDSRGIGTIAHVVAGIEFAVAAKNAYGIEAVNLSLEQAGCSDGTDAVSLAVNAAHDAGLVVVAAVGNRGPGTCTIGSPGAAAKAVTVGATSDLGERGFALAPFSSRGRTLDGRIKPDVVAPGVGITTALSGTSVGYRALSGTSLATPFVTGLGLLMRDASPSLGPQEVKNAITATALDWGRSGDNTAPGTNGPDVDYGAGRLDGYAAIESAAGADIGSAPGMPVHGRFDGNLPGPGAAFDHPLTVIDPSFPIAATLIIPSIAGASASSPNFDLYLLDPDGATVASATTNMRQDALGFIPGRSGTYVLRVRSQSGSGDYFVDVSAGLPPPGPPPQPPPQPAPQPQPQPSSPPAPAPAPLTARASPPSVAATTVRVVRGHRVVVSVRVADCRPCEASLTIVIRGKGRMTKMPANGQNLVGTIENVPSGRWAYAVGLEDTSSGLRSTATGRVFVPRLKLRATVQGSRVLVAVRGVDCRRCRAAVSVRIRNVWRTTRLRRSGTALIAMLGNLPRGHWPFYTAIRYPDGVEVTSEWKLVRVK